MNSQNEPFEQEIADADQTGQNDQSSPGERAVGPIPELSSAEILEQIDTEDIEIDLLLEGIYQKYGYDFRSYSKASIRRRIKQRLALENLERVSQLQEQVLYNRGKFSLLLNDLTINVTEMFRDPEFYRSLREKLVPVLHSYPSIKIWHAGCSTGQEIYSMAILLQEEGLYDKTQIYATDIDKNVLAKAKKGIFSAEELKLYERNYQESGGKEDFSKYYTLRYDNIIMNQALKKNVVFADHDLATDQVFGEMQVVMCRNVIIYFDRKLQDRVFKLFHDSLDMGGFLCLGSKESIRFSSYAKKFSVMDEKYKIYRKHHKPVP
jgi:chemotaxis protein methyltransferase CheR